MTDFEILSQMQLSLIEPADGGVTIPSGLWTPDEFLDALDNGKQFVRVGAAPLLTRATLPTIPNQIRFTLPQNWVVSQRVVWASPDGSKIDLTRDSSWSADYLDPYWTVSSGNRPEIYTDTITPMPQVQVMPPSLDNGVLEVTYVSAETAIPDLLVPIAKWKAIAILLAKDGRGQDLPRAKIANDLATQGLAALNIFLKGWR